MGRFPPCMASCAGGWSIWRSGSSKSSGSRSPSRRSAANCGIWAVASSRRDRAIMRKARKPRRLLKKLSRPRGGDSRKRGSWQADRDLGSRRSSDRAEKQGHPPMGETRDTASPPHDQRTSSAYISGAICPAEGKGAGLVLPSCNSEAMALHLEEISIAVAPGAHAILLLDQAGWHVSKKLPIPDNITLLPFPPKSPELNPGENICQFMRDNWLSNRIFKSYEDILDHCCFAWNKLIGMPWKIMSIGMRDWAHRS